MGPNPATQKDRRNTVAQIYWDEGAITQNKENIIKISKKLQFVGFEGRTCVWDVAAVSLLHAVKIAALGLDHRSPVRAGCIDLQQLLVCGEEAVPPEQPETASALQKNQVIYRIGRVDSAINWGAGKL